MNASPSLTTRLVSAERQQRPDKRNTQSAIYLHAQMTRAGLIQWPEKENRRDGSLTSVYYLL